MQKSMNVAVQKKTHSRQKKAHLFEPTICVFPDGYIYEVSTYNAGASNDASILRNLLSQSSLFPQAFKRGDVFILDRRFRHVVADLRSRGFEVYTSFCCERAAASFGASKPDTKSNINPMGDRSCEWSDQNAILNHG